MTIQEFTTRTGVKVSSEEFDAIHLNYMSSNADKDKFCKAWKIANAQRVAAAKAQKAAEDEYNRKMTRNAYLSMTYCYWKGYTSPKDCSYNDLKYLLTDAEYISIKQQIADLPMGSSLTFIPEKGGEISAWWYKPTFIKPTTINH